MLTGGREDMEIQLDKVHRYSEWSGVRTNIRKCAVTAALYKPGRTGPMGNNPTDAFFSKQFGKPLRIGGQKVPVLLPSETYRYLGIHINMQLTWQKEIQTMLTTLEVRGKALMGSMARNRIGMRVLNGNIISAIQYHLSTIVLTETQMTNLEKKVGIIAKTVTGLPLSVSKDFPHIPQTWGA